MAQQEIKNGITPGMPIPEDSSPKPSNTPSSDQGQFTPTNGITPGWPIPEVDQSNRR